MNEKRASCPVSSALPLLLVLLMLLVVSPELPENEKITIMQYPFEIYLWPDILVLLNASSARIM
jgi:hypothetical protein